MWRNCKVRLLTTATATLLALSLAAAEPKPPVGTMRLETEALLDARVEAAVEPQAIAKELNLSWPVAAPTKAPAAIEADLRRRLQARATGGEVVIDEAALQARAKKAVPLATPGDTVALRLSTGGELRGELQEYATGMVKVSGRTMRSSAVAPESMALLDPAANAAARRQWLQRERTRLIGEQDTTVIGGEAQLRNQLYQAAGYVYWRQQWLSPVTLLEKAVAYRRQTVAKKLRPAVVQEVAARYGFKWQDGQWLPLATPTPPAVTAPQAATEPTPEHAEPAAAKNPIEALFELEIDAPPPAPVALPKPVSIDL